MKRNTPLSPNLRAHVERFIQILKCECLNKFVIMGVTLLTPGTTVDQKLIIPRQQAPNSTEFHDRFTTQNILTGRGCAWGVASGSDSPKIPEVFG